MQHVLHYESEASQKSIDLVQRILNGLDSVQHLLYFPSAARPRCCVHHEALMRLFGMARKKAPSSRRVVDGSKDKKRLGKISRGAPLSPAICKRLMS